MKIEARPWTPQDLIDDLQDIINEESDNYLNTRRTTLEMALAYLKEHFTEPKWIPVTERLPEDLVDVLTCDAMGHIHVFWHHHEFTHPFSIGKHDLRYYPVTHWMPLPEPPQED